MENLTIIIIGIVFGLLISYAGLNRFNTIAGLIIRVLSVPVPGRCGFYWVH